jgi:hypothetical protein
MDFLHGSENVTQVKKRFRTVDIIVALLLILKTLRKCIIFHVSFQSPKGTVRGESRFSASSSAKELDSAFSGNGTNEALVIDILTTLSNDQREDLADEYKHRYDDVNENTLRVGRYKRW